MTALMLQSALMLLIAYFAGCFIGCLARRMTFRDSEALPEGVPLPVPAAAAPVPPPAPAGPVARAATPVMPTPAPAVAPASSQAPAPAAGASEAARRFERALTGDAPTTPPVAPTVEPAKPAAPAPVLPAAIGSSGPATVTAAVTSQLAKPVAPPAAAAIAPAAAKVETAADDLTRIRAIDNAMQGQLNALGVNAFSTIANWKPDDVSRVAGVLKIPGRIEQENWIEQAQILAKGGETYYSRRKARGELASSKPTPDEGDRLTIRVPAQSRPAESPAAAPSATTTGQTKAEPSVSKPVPPEIQAAAAAAAAAVQAAQAAVGATKVTAVPAAQSAQAVPVPAPAPLAPAAAAAPQPTVGMSRDALQRIAGINAEVEKLLNVQGVTRYAQIANWSAADVARFDRLLGFDGRIARENWIEQANILAKGGETAFARDFARRAAEAAAKAATPAKLADAIQANRAAAPSAPPTAPPAAPPSAGSTSAEAAGRSELSNLRSVRSEAYRGPEAIGAGSGSGSRSADDLKRIRGVGVLIEKKLNALGVSRYDQIANWTQSDIERFSDKLDFKGRIERENWVEQARILSAGGQTEFSQRVDRGEVESSKPG